MIFIGVEIIQKDIRSLSIDYIGKLPFLGIKNNWIHVVRKNLNRNVAY